MAATFNMMAGRLEALVHGHRAMLADASHQLRTPLTALRLRLDLLAADSAPAAADELAGAQEEIARLSRLVDGLLATARAESATEQLVNINVVAAVAERVWAWQPVADGHGVKLVVEPAGISDDGKDSSRPLVALGAGHLEQILDNLLDNAIDAIGDERRQRPGLGGELRRRHDADRRRRRPRDDRAGAVPRVPALHHRQPGRHRPRPGHRAPARHRQRRHDQARPTHRAAG